MARTVRLVALSLVAAAAAASTARGVTSLGTVSATSPLSDAGTVRAHQVVAPQTLTVEHGTRPRTPSPTAGRTAHVPARQAPHQASHQAPRHAARVQAGHSSAQRRTRHASTTPRPARHAAVTPEQRMKRAIDRIPGYRDGDAVFILEAHQDHWGLAELHGTIYISARVPANRMYDVVSHEWSHVLSVRAYGGDVDAALAAMNHYFGGSGLTGAERAADCMARELGATWTHYTSCSKASWRAGARRLLARQQL